MDMMWEQQTKKVDDRLDKMESYQYRVKSMASTSARLVPQVCSLRSGNQKVYKHTTTRIPATPTANLLIRFDQANRHHVMTIRPRRVKIVTTKHLDRSVTQSIRPKTVKTIGAGKKRLVPRVHSSTPQCLPRSQNPHYTIVFQIKSTNMSSRSQASNNTHGDTKLTHEDQHDTCTSGIKELD